MFKQIYKCANTAEFHLAVPLLNQRLGFLSYCAGQGASVSTLRRFAQFLVVIIEYLDLKSEGDVQHDQIEEAAQRWGWRQPPHGKMKTPQKGAATFRSIATQWLRFLGRLQECSVPSPHYTSVVEAFARFLSQEKGLSPQTIQTECFYVKEFLGRFCAWPRQLHELRVADLDEALVQKGHQDGYTRGAIRMYAASLRAFFRYAETQGLCVAGLAASVMTPRHYKHELLPLGPSWTDVQRLLAGASGDDPTSIRDRAILLLLAVYGLRSAELRVLRLEDLDWDREVLTVTRPKQRKTQLYPLTPTVGEAIVRYSKEARPRSCYREVFLTRQAPIKPLSPSGLWHVVGRRSREIGVVLTHIGPHSLRHACATHLLSQGLPLKEIGDHLGHRNPDSTRVYAKVDLTGLRKVADFNLGGLV